MFDWKAILALVIILYAFTYAGIWWGIIVAIVCVIALGWRDRHKGPFPTNESKDNSKIDDLYESAKEVTIKKDKASTALLQRELQIDYHTARELLDRLETEGVISPPDGANPRKILRKNENLS